MGAAPPPALPVRAARQGHPGDLRRRMDAQYRALAATLPTNRVYLDALRRTAPVQSKVLNV